jgi:GNAT superfamily N-acetyltransferase
MDEAMAVLERLARIDALDAERAPRGRVLGELRELVREAEVWARLEGDERALTAVAELGTHFDQEQKE